VGGDVDSVTITGASTTAAKLAYLRTLMLESTTTGGYRVFMGRSNIEFYYNTSTSRLDIKYGKNKQPYGLDLQIVCKVVHPERQPRLPT